MTRPSVFSGLDLGPAKSEASPKLEATIVETAPAKAAKATIKTSTYLPTDVHNVLREIAFHEHAKVHDLLIEGVEYILKSRRHPSIREITSRDGKAS